MKYICCMCGWVCEEDVAYNEFDIEPGTKLDELPDEFECPNCYASKELFCEDDD